MYRSSVARLEALPRPIRIALAIAIAWAVVILAGSYFYWVAEGRPGTPQEFRDRVAEAGLDVRWLNNGPTAGQGTTLNECDAPILVTVDDRQGELWVTSDLGREPLTPQAIERIVECG